MSESSQIPPTPKLGSISLPHANDETRIFGANRKRLSSFLGKASKTIMTTKAGISRSMTPAPAPVTRYEYPNPERYHRQRASSMTDRPHGAPIPSTGVAPRYHEATRGEPSKVRQHPSRPGSLSGTMHGAVARPTIVSAGKHQGPDTPKYMKATVKEVPLKDESIVLSWPLLPFSQRRQYPLLYYDVAFDPRDSANVKDNRRVHFLALPDEDRELPVSTHCKLTEIVIHCPHVGSLVVERAEGLRCIDIFYAIYCKYQKKPRSHEMPADRSKYLPAFEQRCNDCPGLAEFNRTRIGFLRVDLLRGKRIFEGLQRTNGRWELLFDVPPRQH
ncbi:hypothetical protein B0H15DRAFT_864351 [Mycena belliarum]|uniref:DUF6699 domain-containing protein n=1 Tax=Mycena belliarum TaxID=1033014 RepID=A0AAD6XJY0_9AGAR|nr:hypothetical protein B0H15DRAFT_864351 [Mycena belliae]